MVFVWPSRISIIVYLQYNDSLYFDNLKLDIFNAMVFSACLSCTVLCTSIFPCVY